MGVCYIPHRKSCSERSARMENLAGDRVLGLGGLWGAKVCHGLEEAQKGCLFFLVHMRKSSKNWQGEISLPGINPELEQWLCFGAKQGSISNVSDWCLHPHTSLLTPEHPVQGCQVKRGHWRCWPQSPCGFPCFSTTSVCPKPTALP